MPLTIPDGEACFVDANILYYHVVDTPPMSEACSDLLERIAKGAITGMTSTHVIAEAVHKVMVAEAAAKFSLSRAGLVNWLQNHRQRIQELQQFREACDEFLKLGLTVLAPDSSLLTDAATISQRLGLLTNDSLIVAMMNRNAVKNLATNDDDFSSIADLTVWQPR